MDCLLVGVDRKFNYLMFWDCGDKLVDDENECSNSCTMIWTLLRPRHDRPGLKLVTRKG